MKNQFIEDCKEDIIDRLHDYEGTTHYLCDLGLTITEGENANGSWYCSTWKAEQDLKDHFDVFGYMWGECKFNFGSDFMADLNPFDDAERVHVILMIELYMMLFDLAVQDFEEWNEEIIVNEEFIDRVRVGLESVDLDI